MYHYLNAMYKHECAAYPANTRKMLTNYIYNYLQIRMERKKKLRLFDASCLRIEWQDSCLRKTELRQALNNPRLRSLFPVDFPEIVISRKLAPV